jgi:hypothetical protein
VEGKVAVTQMNGSSVTEIGGDKKPGRPKSSQARSNAERAKAYRQRKAEQQRKLSR